MDFQSQTPHDYYKDSNLHGSYAKVSLDQIVREFILAYTGDNKIIKRVNRYEVLYHARRGLQELSYDVLREVHAMEIIVNPETLSVILPAGFVEYVRISQVNDKDQFVPLFEKTDMKIASNYLQDHKYNILFDSDGLPLEEDRNSYDPTVTSSSNQKTALQKYFSYEFFEGDISGELYWLDTSKANVNDWFMFGNGVLKFNSQVGGKRIVLEYISDGLNHTDPTKIMIHKFAQEAILAWIEFKILSSHDNIPRNLVMEKSRYFEAMRSNAGIRMLKKHPTRLAQILRGQHTHIK